MLWQINVIPEYCNDSKKTRRWIFGRVLTQSFALALCPSAPSSLSLALSLTLNPSSDNISSVCSPRDKIVDCGQSGELEDGGETEGVLDRLGCGCGTILLCDGVDSEAIAAASSVESTGRTHASTPKTRYQLNKFIVKF